MDNKKKVVRQLLLPLAYRKAYNRNNFFISDSNRLAVQMIDSYPNWITNALIIIGTKESGKTHLCHVLKERDKNINIYDDIDKSVDEEQLFYELNRNDEKILITSTVSPRFFDINLKDLKSRLNSQITVKIENPDDALISAIIIKQFMDKGISPSPRVVKYIMNHSERSFATISENISQIVLKTSENKQNISVPTIKNILD